MGLNVSEKFMQETQHVVMREREAYNWMELHGELRRFCGNQVFLRKSRYKLNGSVMWHVWEWSEEYSFSHIGLCRMGWFISVLKSFLHSSLSCTFSSHQCPPTILPSSLTSSCHLFLGLPLNLFPNSCIIPFWEFYFIPFSVHAQTNVIYLNLLSLL